MDFKTAELKEQFINDVLECLYEPYTLENGTATQGQSISFLIHMLRDPWRLPGGRSTWKNLGGLYDFEDLLWYAGFKVVRGRNRRGNRARVVTV
jgi:hypothetical protein